MEWLCHRVKHTASYPALLVKTGPSFWERSRLLAEVTNSGMQHDCLTQLVVERYGLKFTNVRVAILCYSPISRANNKNIRRDFSV
ncbi:hypothetical protein J3F84DRAFT_361310 [Trichoderma pleuroticola]